jgi:hypothetical protein
LAALPLSVLEKAEDLKKKGLSVRAIERKLGVGEGSIRKKL